MQRVQDDSVSGGPRNGEGKPGVAGQSKPGRQEDTERCGPWGQIMWGLWPIGKICLLLQIRYQAIRGF